MGKGEVEGGAWWVVLMMFYGTSFKEAKYLGDTQVMVRVNRRGGFEEGIFDFSHMRNLNFRASA